ncbi:MAG: endolytic transglycosylase MltG [Gemmatimonadaceae bacterium]
MVAAAAMVACIREPGGPMIRVTIPSGATFREAADSLSSAGIISSSTFFGLYARINGEDRGIKAGTYVLQRGTPWPDLVRALSRGQGIEARVTIPEGYALRDIVTLLAAEILVPLDSVEEAVRDTSLLRRLRIPSETLEGYLFPDTYRFAYGSTALEAVDEMVRRFDQVWSADPAWEERLRELAMTRHDIVTLASIIEKEGRLDPERPVISAVYHNRLRDGMPLQADPTVQYSQGRHSSRVLYRDLQVESPYNTYRNKGLPPGPIASPGKASLQAALYPANVPFKYFVAHPDGHHEFRVTFKQHVEARQDIRRSQADSDKP